MIRAWVRRSSCLVLATALCALVRPGPAAARGLHPEELGYAVPGLRALLGGLRPLVMPFLWHSVQQALVSGRTADLAAAVRWLTLVAPELQTTWDVLGWRLAYDLGATPLSLDEELARIVAALRWLEQGSRIQRDDPELCLTIVTILQDRLGARTERTAALGALWRERLGQDPLQAARDWIAEAGRRGLRHGIGDRLALNAVALARRAFQRQDLNGARHWAAVAAEGFASEAGHDTESAAWARELREQDVPALDQLLASTDAAECAALRARLAATRLELR